MIPSGRRSRHSTFNRFRDYTSPLCSTSSPITPTSPSSTERATAYTNPDATRLSAGRHAGESIQARTTRVRPGRPRPLRHPSRDTARTGTSGSSPRRRPLQTRDPSRPRPRRSPARYRSQDLARQRRYTATPRGMPPLLPPRHRRAQELPARPQIRRLPLLQARALHETQARSDFDRWSENFTFNWSVTISEHILPIFLFVWRCVRQVISEPHRFKRIQI